MSEEDELGVIRDEWVHDEHTKRVLKELKKEEELFLRSLMTACSHSADPKVMYAFIVHMEVKKRITLFETGLSSPKH